MIESWRFINGEKIMFPVTSHEAKKMGWHQVRHNFYGGSIAYDDLNNWLRENVSDRAYWLGTENVYFYRASDATMFTLRWL